jgi:DUF1365 family protein
MKKVGLFSIFSLLFVLMFSTTAFAYIDPATTSYLIQIIAGVVISCGVVVGVFWKKIRLFFKNRKIASLEKKLTREAQKDK